MDKDDEQTTHVEWSAQVEDILAGEGEKCRGLSWIHMRCETEMTKYNTLVQVPVIVLSTLAGTASVGATTLFGSGNSTTSGIAIGMVSIAVGILNTLGGFFNFAKRSEAHRIAHLHYSKISSKIQIELSLPRLERDSAESLLNYVRDSMERLAETTPLASEQIVKDFNTQFEKLKDEIAMPPETNGLHKIKVYRSNGPVPTPKFSFDMEVPANVPDKKAAQLIAAQAQTYIDKAASEVHLNMENTFVPLNTTVKIHQPKQTILIPPPSSTPQSSRSTPQRVKALPLHLSPSPMLMPLHSNLPQHVLVPHSATPLTHAVPQQVAVPVPQQVAVPVPQQVAVPVPQYVVVPVPQQVEVTQEIPQVIPIPEPEVVEQGVEQPVEQQAVEQQPVEQPVEENDIMVVDDLIVKEDTEPHVE